MYDPATADLIRATPELPDLDCDTLPDRLTEAFAQIAALRVRLRAGDGPPEDLLRTRQFARQLAHTNEALVALTPARENRRSAAFVAATAYQLLYQIDALSTVEETPSRLTSTAVSPAISAMLLFLVAESSADATEVARRVRPPAAALEQELVRTLVDLARGQLGSITQRAVPASDTVARSFGHDAASNALYHLVLRGVRRLAADLAGLATDTDDARATLRQVQQLAAPTEDLGAPVALDSDPLELGPLALFSGPFHLASLLLAVADTLTAAAVINVPAPPNLPTDTWRHFVVGVAQERPYLWPNHQHAIGQGYLRRGVSSVVGFPTGAGKSAVSQMKVAATILSGKNAILLAPTHALVDQTVRDLKRAFPKATVQGERPDEFSFLDPQIQPHDIVVMTPEACLLLGHIDPGAFAQVGVLVFDECHLVHPANETDRRSVDAMLCILNFARLAPEADLVLLSAMMRNTAEVADWLAELTGRQALAFDMAWKPTRQLRGCVVYEQSRIQELQAELDAQRPQRLPRAVPQSVQSKLTARPHGFFSIRQTWDSKRRADYAYLPFCAESPPLGGSSWWRLTPNAGVLAASLAVPAAKTGINALIFSQTIRLAASIAKRISNSLGPCAVPLTQAEQRLAMIAIDELGDASRLYVDVSDDKLTSRAAAHHGQLLSEERRLIELLYARPDGLAVLSATPTLGQGINLPSELVIIAEDSRFDEASGQRQMLEARELLNAAGRAGRAGKNATGVVVAIPGKVVGFDETAAKIGSRWSRLQEIFGQTDQCLDIDDPLTSILDRIHSQSRPPDDLHRYVVARLCGVIEDGDLKARVRDTVRRTFAAFRRRQQADSDWVESRTQAAFALLGGVDPNDEVARAARDLSSSLGLPEDLVSSLTVDVLESAPPLAATIAEWRGWLFKWMSIHADQTVRMLRREDLERQFGSKYKRLTTERARVDYALPKLEKALELWMAGEPLVTIEDSLAGATGDRRKSNGARKFVVRLLPTLAHAFAAPALIVRRHWTDSMSDPHDVAPALFALTHCVRHGFSSLEMYALYDHLQRYPHRREVHRRFQRIAPYLQPAPDGETLAETKARVAAAASIV